LFDWSEKELSQKRKSEATMKKLTLPLVALFLFVAFYASTGCCTTINDLEARRDAGKKTSVVYEQDWETVYAAVKFVWRHSENPFIAEQYGRSWIDYAIEEKAIYSSTSFVGIGIFFEPISPYQTKVDYVTSGYIGYHQGIIDATIEELPYLLKNGRKAYREYTNNLAIQKEKKREAEKKSQSNLPFK
jgi:hypothetical protein